MASASGIATIRNVASHKYYCCRLDSLDVPLLMHVIEKSNYLGNQCRSFHEIANVRR